MRPTWIVVNTPVNWDFTVPGVEVLSAREYLTDEARGDARNARVFNLCRSFRHMSMGYYVSLLAEARGHRPLPSISTIQDMRSPAILREASSELDELIQRSLSRIRSKRFELSVYFGRNLAQRYSKLALHLFNLFPVPMLRAVFERHKRWELVSLSTLAAREVPISHRDFVAQSAAAYFARGREHHGRRRRIYRYELAILHNPEEIAPPSNPAALRRFERAFEAQDLGTTFIQRDDYGRVAEFDALFIRETTAVDHHTYRFSARAAAAGLVVIDDPESIIRCANKVYLAELLSHQGIPTPATSIVHRDNLIKVAASSRYPCILKRPDGSFSQGVVKAEHARQFVDLAVEMLEASDLIVVQEFMPTEFDWRVGILGGEALFVCRYYMARRHWQIYQWRGSHAQSGRSDCVSIDEAPKRVVKTALKAARLIGDGFYGVDLKEIRGKVVVIEINDNPSVDRGCEDEVLGKSLYDRVGLEFVRRLDRRHDAWVKR